MSNEVLDFYSRIAQQNLAPIAWLAHYQQQALHDLQALGLPSPKHENWKYTLLDSFYKHRFSLDASAANANSLSLQLPSTSASKHSSMHSTIATSLKSIDIYINNGQIVIPHEISLNLPQGVLIKPLSVMLREHETLIKPYLGQCLQHEHGFHALNSAMLQQGVVIYLPQGVHLAEPIVLKHWQDNNEQAVYLRHLVIAEAHTKATIIEEFSGETACVYHTNSITEIALRAQARITHYKIQDDSQQAFHFGHVYVQQDKHSELFSHVLSLGGQLSRSDISVSLNEANACCLLNGIYITNDNQHHDHHTVVNHRVGDCISEQDYKGILLGRSRAVFSGEVNVARDAQKTRATQQNKNLLLSTMAEVDTKPQLNIDADDVVCAHGATVGQLDEDAKFYLSSRGMDEGLVERYLIQAFITNNMQLIDDANLHAGIMARINEQLKEI